MATLFYSSLMCTFSSLVPSSVQDVSYENISSTSIFVSWNPPLNPNGKITHYTVYTLNLHSHQTQQQVTNLTTSIVLTGQCPESAP